MTDEGAEKSGRQMSLIAVCSFMPAFAWFGSGAPILPSVLLFLNLYVLALYDWHSFRLPNLFTLTLALTGCLSLYIAPRYTVPTHLVGGLVGLLFFPALNFLYRLVRGRDGIGLGDAKLMGGIGLWLGWPTLPFVLLIASVAGLGYGILTIGRKRRDFGTARIPFGPFLCFGAWVSWLYF